MLAEIYGWFTEGFDTADLKDAKALLDELSTEHEGKMRCANCGTENPHGLKFCNQCGAPYESAARNADSTTPGREILRRMRHRPGRRQRRNAIDSSGAGIAAPSPESACAGAGSGAKFRGRAQDGHGAVRRHQGLDGADGGPRPRGGARDRRSGAEADDRRGASLRRLHRAVHRRRHLRAVRRAGRARGSSAARALRCAADAGGDAALLGSAAERGQLPIQVRVGVNTGEVVVRSIRPARGTPSTRQSGIPPAWRRGCRRWRRSARLRSPGRRKSWWKDISPSSRWGRPRVKGVSEPVNVYEVAGLGPLRTRLQVAARRGLTKFVGRQAELEQMQRALESARDGPWSDRGGDGRAGSRQVAPVLRVQGDRASGCLVLEAYSVSHGKASAYLPVIDFCAIISNHRGG